MLLGLYEEYGNAVQVAMFYRTEEDMRAFLAHPRSVVGSRRVAMAQAGSGGAEDDREPADRCRLAGRGYLRPGYAADLVIFATGSVQDRATFAASNQLPAGIDRVLVNGVEVVSEGAWDGRAAGRMLRWDQPG